MRNKKGVSVVVITVLMVLIGIAAVSLIAGYIIPMVRESLEEGGTCFELRDHAQILPNEEYTCYTGASTKLMIERGLKNYTILGFVVSITSGPGKDRYDVKETGSTEGITMYDGSTTIKIPGPGGAASYTFPTGSGESVELGVITGTGKICEIGTFLIPPCSES